MIIAKRVSIIIKGGIRMDYSHVTYIDAQKGTLTIKGERGEDITDLAHSNRIDVCESYTISELELMQVDFYIPKV